MPHYTARHKKNGKEKPLSISIAEVDQWEKDNPQWEIAIGAPLPGYNLYSIRPTGHLREQIHEMKKKIPHHNLNKYDY